MANFNLYIEQLDYNPIIDLIKENGEQHILKKREYFVRQHEMSRYVAWVKSGVFHYTCIGDDGCEHIVGYSFENEFVCDYKRLLDFYCDTPEQRYVKLMKRCPDLKSIVPLKDIASFLNVTPETVSHIRRKLLQK